MCLPQCRSTLQGVVHRNSLGTLAQGRVRLLWPQRHTCTTSSAHGGHAPVWHDKVHAWPQGRNRPHGAPHVGIGSSQCVRPVAGVRPQGQVRIRSGARGHGATPVRTWHGCVQRWTWHDSGASHGSPHDHADVRPYASEERSPQTIERVWRPQWHGASLINTAQGAQGPAWHGCGQVWCPHARGRPQTAPHDTRPLCWSEESGCAACSAVRVARSCEQRSNRSGSRPQKQATRTVAAHGGHGPG